MIVVAAILEKGDVFLRGNVKYRVTAVDEYYVYYATNPNHKNGKKYSEDREQRIGIKSKEKMILIEDCDVRDPKLIGKMYTIEFVTNSHK